MYLKSLIHKIVIAMIITFILTVSNLEAQNESPSTEEERLKEYQFIVFWEGTDPKMSLADLAAYCAPIFWYSPDEPELKNKTGKDIRIPAAFPFEDQVDAPVVYYQVSEILVSEEGCETGFFRDDNDLGKSQVDLRKCVGFNIDYNHYYKYEVGLGKHNHDTEQVQFKVYVHQYTDDANVQRYQLYLIQTTAKAHALA